MLLGKLIPQCCGTAATTLVLLPSPGPREHTDTVPTALRSLCARPGSRDRGEAPAASRDHCSQRARAAPRTARELMQCK